jgi:hypothetical protein
VDVSKLAELRHECEAIRVRALAITDKPELTPADRKQFEELVELLEEIRDYSARLTRRNEKWRLS